MSGGKRQAGGGKREGGLQLDDYRQAAELREALRVFHRHSEQLARAHGLTPQRYELLLMIKAARDGSERAGLHELVERLQLAPSTVTELVHRAEDLGLVRRELRSNRGGRRGLDVALTAEGERRLARAVADLAEDRRRLASILADLGLGARPQGDEAEPR